MVEPVYYGHLGTRLGTSQKCPNYQGVLIFSKPFYILYDKMLSKMPFWTLTKCLDYAGVLIFPLSILTGFTVYVSMDCKHM